MTQLVLNVLGGLGFAAALYGFTAVLFLVG